MRRSLLIIALLVIVGGAVTAAFWVLRSHGNGSSGLKGGLFAIESTPSGASVRLGTTELGQTPYFGDNPLAAGASAEVTITLRGYRVFTQTVTGGQDVRISVSLQRASNVAGDARHSPVLPAAQMPGPPTASGPPALSPEEARRRGLDATDLAATPETANEETAAQHRHPLVPPGH